MMFLCDICLLVLQNTQRNSLIYGINGSGAGVMGEFTACCCHDLHECMGVDSL